jgi:hypothetical protein
MPVVEFHYLKLFVDFNLSGIQIENNTNSEINTLLSYILSSILLFIFFQKFKLIKSVEQFPNILNISSLFFSLIISYLFIFLLFRQEFLIAISSYEGNVISKGKSGLFSFFCDFITISSSIFALIFFNNKLFFRSILLIIVPFTMGLILSSKDEIIIGLITILNTFFFLKKKKGKFFLSLVFLIIAPLFSIVFSVYRTPDVSIFDLNSYVPFLLKGVYLSSDVGGNFAVYRMLTDSIDRFQLGIGHLEGLKTFLPNFLFERGLDPAELMAKNVFEDYQRGMGVGYSFFGEAYINFGFLAALSYIFYFIILKLLFNFITKIFNVNSAFLVSFVLTYYCYSIVVMHRSFLFGSVKSQIYFFLIIYAFYFIFRLLSSLNKVLKVSKE